MPTTVPPGSIVVALDPDDHSRRALDWASTQAEVENRPVDVVHALDLSRLPSAAWLGATGDALPLAERLRLEARTAVGDAVAQAHLDHPAVELRSHVLEDAAPRALTALSQSAHLLVLGSHGRGPVVSRILGSVSAAVSRRTRCPTVVVRPPHDDPAPTGGAGVVVGVDGSPDSRPVVEFAFHQASLRGMPLTVVHAVSDVLAAYAGDALHPLPEDPDLAPLLLAESVAGMAEKYPDVVVTRRLERGLLDQVLDRRHEPWDLVVVGRARHGAWHRLVLGSTTTAVLEHATTPVAVVPEASTTGR
ncbi:Universal stress protein [Nocardioides aquaticus]|uniref:Universal stress protein n=1 Tax=Nocardioides aquaticus TaxID=160826 RepID=A0ABX8EIP6_9ACTN|nr:universal stress protein [Nocardioides aquaticus]QVT79765.1 Universal stress protein [Nocardioides aquaticus]